MCLVLSRLDWTSSLLTPNPLMDFILPGPHVAVVGFSFAAVLPLDIVDILALECVEIQACSRLISPTAINN